MLTKCQFRYLYQGSGTANNRIYDQTERFLSAPQLAMVLGVIGTGEYADRVTTGLAWVLDGTALYRA